MTVGSDRIVPGAPAGQGGKAGFSVMEVLVAVVVGAIMSASIIGLQGQIMHMSRSSEDLWENLNLSQDILTKRFPDELVRPTNMWFPWTVDNGEWRLTKTQESGQRQDWMLLQTKVLGSELSWVWPQRPTSVTNTSSTILQP